MYALGVRDATRNRRNHYSVVLLDIGGQVPGGVRQTVSNRYVTYAGLVSSISAYLDGYAHARDARALAVIAVGTNNDLNTSRAAGAAWANRLVDPLRQHAGRMKNLEVIGADDIEPGFSAGFEATRQWVRGYLGATAAPLLYNGSADGCKSDRIAGTCNRGWTVRQIAWLAGLAAPTRILVLPQIYNHEMARQWGAIARTASAYGKHKLRIVGPLTENAACAGQSDCPTMRSADAWLALWHVLRTSRLSTVSSLPAQADLDIH